MNKQSPMIKFLLLPSDLFEKFMNLSYSKIFISFLTICIVEITLIETGWSNVEMHEPLAWSLAIILGVSYIVRHFVEKDEH